MAKNKRTVVRFRVNMLFTGDDVSFEEKNIEGRLEEMRWLKSKVFFGSLTDQALESFK